MSSNSNTKSNMPNNGWFNIFFVMYVIFAAAIVLGGSYYLNSMNGMSTVYIALYFFGSLYVCFMYGLRWFGGDNTLLSNPTGTWPPVINTCPDYLIYHERKVNGKTVPTCIDRIGVSKNGGLSVFPKDGIQPVDDKYYFNLKTDSTDSDMKNAELCQRAITAGLTWEGITNGESCIQSDGSTAMPSSGGSGKCS